MARTPTIEQIADWYKSELAETFRKSFPSDRFDIRYGEQPGMPYLEMYFDRIMEQEETVRGLVGEKKRVVEKRQELALFKFTPEADGKFNLEAELYDPCFIRACGTTLFRINEQFVEHLSKYYIGLIKK